MDNIDLITEDYNELANNIRFQMQESFKAQLSNIKYRVMDIITESFDIDKKAISDFIESQFINEINKTQTKSADKMINKIELATKSRINSPRKLSQDREKSSLNVLINEALRDYSLSSLENVVQEFIGGLNVFHNREMGSRATGALYETKEANVRAAVKGFISPLVENTYDELKKYLAKITHEFVEKVTNNLANNFTISKSDINNVRLAAKSAGITFSGTDNNIMINVDGEEMPVIKNEAGSITTPDGRISITPNGRDQVTIIKDKNTLTSDNTFITFGPNSLPRNYRIDIGFNDYTFSCGGKKLTDPIKIGFVISALEKAFPSMYQELSQNPAFSDYETTSLEADKNSQKLYKDADGMVRINDKNREQFITTMHDFGFSVNTDAKGVYLTDEFNVTSKIDYNNAIKLENNPSITINTDFYIIGPSGIYGPTNRFSDFERGISLFISPDYSKTSLSVGDDMYTITEKNGQLEYHARVNNVDKNDADLVINTMRTYFPNALTSIMAHHNVESNTDSLLNELEEGELSLADKLFKLEQNPIVQEYLKLKEKQAEIEAVNNASYFL